MLLTLLLTLRVIPPRLRSQADQQESYINARAAVQIAVVRVVYAKGWNILNVRYSAAGMFAHD